MAEPELTKEEKAVLAFALHVEDNVHWLKMRRLGLAKPHARFVKQGERYHPGHEPAWWSHWIIIYRSNMICHCESLQQVYMHAVMMPCAFKAWWTDKSQPKKGKHPLDLGIYYHYR
jgi:hypothetical protein